MDWRRHVRSRIEKLDIAPEREVEIVEELAQQLEEVYESARSAGAGEEEAMRRADAELGDGRELAAGLLRAERPLASRVPAALRPSPATPALGEGNRGILSGLGQDLRYALRGLRREPGFTAVAVATLALTIGAATLVYTLVDRVLLRPLPVADPERLVVVSAVTPTGEGGMSLAWGDFLDLGEQSRSFSALAGWAAESVNLTGDGAPEQLSGRRVTSDLLSVLGVRPVLGRDFVAGDDVVGAEPVAIVSHRFWMRRLGGDPGAIGRTIRLDDQPTTVVGVLPPSFAISRSEEILRPLRPLLRPGSYRLLRMNHWGLRGIGRLRDGVSVASADVEVRSIAERLAAAHPDTSAGQSGEATALGEAVVGSVRPMLWVLFAAVGALLAIGCVNLANLQLARAATRRQENAVRSALGAGSWRLARLALSESLLLAMLGGTLGAGLAFAGLRAVVRLLPASFPRLDQLALDPRVLAVTALAAMLTGLLFGLAPALRSGLAAPAPLLRGSRVTSGSGVRASRRGILLVAEIALAVVLTAGAGLMVRTLSKLLAVDPGFRTEQVLTTKVQLPGARYDGEAISRFYAQAEERLSALPGVDSVAVTASLPVEGVSWSSVFVLEGRPELPRAEVPSLALVPVSPSYFDTLGIPLVAGRGFTPDDRAGVPTVAVVTESFARRYFPGESPLGHRFKQGWTAHDWGQWMEIVGVVRDVKLQSLDSDPGAAAYLPMAQRPQDIAAFLVRVAGDPSAFARAVEAALHELDPDLPLVATRPMRAVVADDLGQRRLTMWLLAGFAALALILAAVGVFGVTAYLVAQRRREFGVRMALGADRAGVLRMVFREGALTAALGVVLGLAGAWALTGAMRSLLFEVAPRDPASLVSSAAALLGASAAATLVPALRAARVDPVTVLRDE